MPNRKVISIVIADDHLFFREGLINVIKSNKRLQIVGVAGTGKELIDLVAEQKPMLAIVDIGMPMMNGIEATKVITGMEHKTSVIALTMHTEEAVIYKMLEAGAKGYLEKNISKEELFLAIESIVDHDQFYFPESSTTSMFRLMKRLAFNPYPKPTILFSDRELEVLQLVCQDFSSKEIANSLSLSNRTIETHRVNIMQKMNVKSVAGMVAYAYTQGLVQF
jgi:DNA-binding NarL/FixJ family response regulator